MNSRLIGRPTRQCQACGHVDAADAGTVYLTDRCTPDPIDQSRICCDLLSQDPLVCPDKAQSYHPQRLIPSQYIADHQDLGYAEKSILALSIGVGEPKRGVW